MLRQALQEGHLGAGATNLLARLREYRQDVWRFMTDEGVPFTNTLAEQALRMSQGQTKDIGLL